MHSEGLVTADVSSRRLVARLAEQVPSLDDGTITLLPDGRMRVRFALRKGVTWHDGAPFTAQDLTFTYALGGPGSVRPFDNRAITYIVSVEAPDDHTFIVEYKEPYYLGAALGLSGSFWPMPRHLLEGPYERYLASGNAEEVMNQPYWTSEYVHLGPFRLTRFDPGEGLTFQAYPGYFLGRPNIDTIRVRIFGDQNTLFSSLLAESVDLTVDGALRAPDLGIQLKQRWESTQGGTVHLSPSSLSMLAPQMRPAVQMEPTLFDPRVRRALFQAMDRETLSEAVNGYRELVAWSILLPSDVLYEATKDTLRRYPHDLEAARVGLREAGWTPAADGQLRHSSDGRLFRTAIWMSAGREREGAAYADFWRRIGVDVTEHIVPAARARDNEYRSSFPGWEGTGADIRDTLVEPPAGPENRWTGTRSGYDDARATGLVHALRASIDPRGQLAAMAALNEYLLAEMLLVPLYYSGQHLVARRGVKALDDVAGGEGGNPRYGTYTRNARSWDLE
jgi:peptide/nickel transport system substrate-binding protein